MVDTQDLGETVMRMLPNDATFVLIWQVGDGRLDFIASELDAGKTAKMLARAFRAVMEERLQGLTLHVTSEPS